MFAKRTQRWRAYLAAQRGISVSYQISPPASTWSVLSHRILHATYAGGPKFGLIPLDNEVARAASAAVLVADVLQRAHSNRMGESMVAIHQETAIHGGLWRVAYRPNSIWVPATILGIGAWLKMLLKPKK